MINLKETMVQSEFERPRNSAANIVEEGQILIGHIGADGAEEVKECSNAAPGGWYFVGFSKLDSVSPANSEVLYEESLEVPSSPDSDGLYLVELGHGNITVLNDANGDVAVYNVDGEAWLTLGANIADGTFVVSDAANGVLKFHSAQAGLVINVQYRRELSAKDRDMKYYHRHINNAAQADQDVVGVMSGPGYICIDQFDASVGDWTSGTLKTGLNGSITMDGNGIDLSGILRVIRVPSAEKRSLQLAFI